MTVHHRGNQKWTKRREFRARLLLLLGSLLISLAVIEVALRITGYSYPQFLVADTHSGYTLRPGSEGWYRKEGQAYVRINRDGLRDREHAREKPPNMLRVAVLADSYTAAFEVPLEDSFCPLLERKLRDCSNLRGRNVEVINFGVPGYGTAQEPITLRHRVWQYSPDIVLLAVATSNDISDNERALKNMNTIPYFVWRDGKLVEDDSFLQVRSFRVQETSLYRAGTWLIDHLRIIQGISDVARTLKIRSAERRAQASRAENSRKALPSGDPGTTASADAGEELGLDSLVYREPSDPIWSDAWRVTEGLIAMMRDEVQSRGAKFLVVTLSNGVQVWPDPAVRQAFLRNIGATDILYPDNRIRAFCEQEAIPVASLAPAMQSYAEENKVFLNGFGQNIGNGHWNTLGNRVAAELTAPKLCDFLQNRDR